jgi:WD40 repeat protein
VEEQVCVVKQGEFSMNRRIRCIVSVGVIGLALWLMACAPTSASVASHALTVTAAPPIPLTFYEGEDDTEPFTPFLVAAGQQGNVMTFGYADREGAYYIATYASANTWDEVSISNGFAPSDPLWDCDAADSTSTTIAATGTLMARSCADGSVTAFALPNALAIYHQNSTSSGVGLSSRAPVTAFSPDGTKMALTDDGPGGAGHTITVLGTTTWQTLHTITVSAGLLSRPSWSANGAFVAAVDLDGMLRVWSASTGSQVAAATLPAFSSGTAANDIAGPAPLWSGDDNRLYAFTPTAGGTEASAWSFNGSALAAQAHTHVAYTLNETTPQLSPDGAHLFMQTSFEHAQIFQASSLAQVGDFPLAGNLAVWTDAQHLAIFTTNASVVVMQIGA